MCRAYPVLLAPASPGQSYEVDLGFVARFTDDDPANERFFADGREGHAQFDIEGYVAARLASAGVTTDRATRARHLQPARAVLQLSPLLP